MTLGTGILLSTVLVLLAVAVHQVSVRNKWKVVGKIVGALIGMALLAGGGVWGWSRYQNRPKVVEVLSGVRLGMSPLDVKLAKGAPKSEDLATKEKDEYRAGWVFNESDSGPSLLVLFYGSESTNLRVSIVCETDGYSTFFGLGRFSSEDAVIAKLGKPTRTSIAKDGLQKMISYEPYKVVFTIAKGAVTDICISESKGVKFAEEYQASQTEKTK
jgi:hypothetical protein